MFLGLLDNDFFFFKCISLNISEELKSQGFANTD